jgi:PEGA domain
MKRYLKITVIFAGFFTIFLLIFTPLQAELIEPTQTLKTAAAESGQLTVFSEPPDLMVKLDGTPVGQTPVRIQAVAPGDHQLQVRQSVTDINIESGEAYHISLFRDKFIRFQGAKSEALKNQASKASQRSEAPIPQSSPEQIKIKKENREAWERWMNFVNGSSSHF